MSFPAPPVQTPFFLDDRKTIAPPWLRFFQQISTALNGTAVTGSLGGNTALASLISNLSTQGIVNDQTSP